MTKQFKVGQFVWVKSEKMKGKVHATLPNHKYKVEIITSFNKETGERTTKLLAVNASELAVYRDNKRKKAEPGNEFYNDVYAFHKEFGHPTAEKPTPIPLDEFINRAGYVIEELLEGIYGTVGGDIQEFEKASEELMFKFLNNKNKIRLQAKPVDDVLVAQADSLIDSTYFINGMLVVGGIKPHNLFKIVQNANMGKLHNVDGVMKAVYREGDGKIVKPDGWEEKYAPEPLLRAELERQKLTQ